MTDMQQEKHILVLGGSGKLAQVLRKTWQATPSGQPVFHWQFRENTPAGDVLWKPGTPPPADLPDIAAILALWGVTPGPGRDLAENRRLALTAMALGQSLGAERVLHCSSAAVYPPGPEPLGEAAAGGDVNLYGQAKLDMEAALSDWVRANPQGPSSCAMRIANVGGADSLFSTLGREPDRVPLDRFADGTGPRRSYISPNALARAIMALLTCRLDMLPTEINLAVQPPLAMADIARAAGRNIDWRDAPPTAAPMVHLDTTRLSRLIALPAETPSDLIAQWRSMRSVA